MYISAIVCSRNRAKYLNEAINSLIDQTLPKEFYEILVVDNNSDDNTKEVVFGKIGFVQNLRYLCEETIGISFARNKGWIEARGKYICYMDDDEIADPNWLEKMMEIFKTPGCDSHIIGGRVYPIWESPRPDWLSEKIEFYVGIKHYFDKPLILNDIGICLATSNMGLPRLILQEIGGFNINFKRGEDTLLQLEAMKRGYKVFYHPELIVRHHIPPERLKKMYFLRWAFSHGAHLARIMIYIKALSRLERLRASASALLRVFKPIWTLLNSGTLSSKGKVFSEMCSIVRELGYIAGLIGLAK